MSTIPVKNILSALSVVGAGLLMVSCDNDNTSNDAPTEAVVDSQLVAIIIQRNLTGDPADGLLIPEIDSPMAQLGMALFFSKSL